MATRQRALVNGAEYEFLADENAPNCWQITLGQQTFAVEIRPIGNDSFSALAGARSFGLQIRRAGNEFIVETRHGSLRIELVNHAGKSQAARASGPTGPAMVTAMMPGRVVEVLVAPGAEVAAGQGLVVLEAMKMENELKAPKAGRIVEVKVSASDTVEQGQVLVIIE